MTTYSAGTRLKLGKLPAKTDDRTLSLETYVDAAILPTPPRELNLTAGVSGWPMYANDRLGDCTCAAAGHMIEAWTAASRGRSEAVSESAVLDAFDAVKVVDPLTGEEGAIELDVLKYWRSKGIGRHHIAAFVTVGRVDHELVRAAAYLFGGLYIGLQLPITAQGQSIWDSTETLDGPAAPGSWGGHAVNVVGYDDAYISTVTWGRIQRLTWSFWDAYCDEGYSVLSPDFLNSNIAPNGFDVAALREDLRLVTGGEVRS